MSMERWRTEYRKKSDIELLEITLNYPGYEEKHIAAAQELLERRLRSDAQQIADGRKTRQMTAWILALTIILTLMTAWMLLRVEMPKQGLMRPVQPHGDNRDGDNQD